MVVAVGMDGGCGVRWRVLARCWGDDGGRRGSCWPRMRRRTTRMRMRRVARRGWLNGDHCCCVEGTRWRLVRRPRKRGDSRCWMILRWQLLLRLLTTRMPSLLLGLSNLFGCLCIRELDGMNYTRSIKYMAIKGKAKAICIFRSRTNHHERCKCIHINKICMARVRGHLFI